jgi:hypothetical protein
MMRLLRSPVPVVLASSTVVLVVLAVLLSDATAERAGASHAGGMDAMSIDMDPGASPANTATSVGSIEQCARINENDMLDADEDGVDEVTVDVTAEGIPLLDDGGTPTDQRDDHAGFLGFQYEIHYDEDQLTVQSGNSDFLLGTNAGGSVLDASDVVPDAEKDGYWTGAAINTAFPIPAGGTGVIQRLGLATDEGAQAGQTVLRLREDASVHLDATGAAFLPKAFGFANIAVDQACGGLVTPGPIPLPAADLKVTGLDITPPLQAYVGLPVGFGAEVTFHNNGPNEATLVNQSMTLFAPSDCHPELDTVHFPSPDSLSVSIAYRHQGSFQIECSELGAHEFTIRTRVGTQQQPDPNPLNQELTVTTVVDFVAEPPVTPTPCCQPPLPTPCTGPCPQNPSTPIFEPGGVVCFEDFASPAECDGDPSPGAATDIRTKFCIGQGADCSSLPGSSREASLDGLVFFTPPPFELIPGAPLGAIGGQLDAELMLGLLDGPCDKRINARFTLLNSSTDLNDTISPKPVGEANVMEPLAQDVDGNDIPDGVDHYPVFLRNHFDPDWDAGPDSIPDTSDDAPGPEPPAQPIRRLGGFTKVMGNWLSVQLLVFKPGDVLPFGGYRVQFKTEFGYPVVVVIQDPTAPDSPLPISDFCVPFEYNFVTFGKSWDNPCTNGPDSSVTRGNCPDEFDLAIQEAGYPLFPCDPNNSVDEDLDGVVNDGCAQVNLQPETGAECENATSDDGEDSTVNDGCPQVGDVSEGGYIGGPCAFGSTPSPAPPKFNEGGCLFMRNPGAEESVEFITVAASARDADGDGWDNIIDTCALIPNPDWNPNGFDPQNDPDNDGLPNECDPDPTKPSPQSPTMAGNPNRSCFDTGIVGGDEDQDCYSNRHDNCPLHDQQDLGPNAGEATDNVPLQTDIDGDGIGDACDVTDCNAPPPSAFKGDPTQYISFCQLFGTSVGPTTPDGERAFLCMRFTLQVAAGAPPSAGPPVIDRDPNCFLAPLIMPGGDPAGPGEGNATSTPGPLSTTSPGSTQPAGAVQASPTPTRTPSALGVAGFPSTGGDVSGSAWAILGLSLAGAFGLLTGAVFVRRRLARARVRME